LYKRILALTLIICFILSAMPVQAMVDVVMPVESEQYEPDVQPSEGNTGAEGIFVEGEEIVLPETEEPEPAAPEALYIVLPGNVYGSGAVEDTLPGLAVSTGSLSMVIGSFYSLSAVTEDGSECSVEWTSSDESVAVVDESGTVTALKWGETTITATAENGVNARCIIRVGRVAEEVRFDTDVFYLGVGETAPAPGVVMADGGEGYFGGYNLESDKTKYVRVNDDGTLTGKKAGSATVTLTTENNVRATVKVVVRKAPSKITASAKKITLGVGETYALGYKLPKGTFGRVQFESLNEDYVVADENTGLLRAVAEGSAKVRISTYNNKSCTVSVKVLAAPESIALSTEDLLLGVGQKHTLKAVLNKNSASLVHWTSSDETVARVENGKVTAVGAGYAKITASTHVDGVAATCEVNVLPAPEFVKLPWEKIYIGVGETVQLEPDVGDGMKSLSYSSSKKKYATVSDSGLVKGKSKGSATITVKSYNGKTAKVKVVVGKAPSKITAEKRVLGLYESGFLKYSLPKGTYSDVSFESLTPDIVSVDPETGMVTAVSEGEGQVKLETFNKKSCISSVSVVKAPEKIEVMPGSLEMRVGETTDIIAETDEGAHTSIRWISQDETVAVVENGVVRAVGAGRTSVIALSHIEGVFGECAVNVAPAPETLVVMPQSIQMGIGEHIALTVSGGEPDGEYTFTADKSGRVTVTDAGEIVGKRAGKASVTVASADGQRAKISITVGKKPGKVTAVPARMVLGINETGFVGGKLPSGCFGSITYESLNADIASVDSATGEVRAKAAGTAIIEIRTYNHKTAQAAIEVVNAPESIELNDYDIVIGEGLSANLTARVNEGASSRILWTCEGDAVTVEDGLVKGVKPGEAFVTAHTYLEGVSATCRVTVKAAPEKVELPEKKIYIGIGEKVQLEPDAGDSAGGFTYASSKNKIASVSKAGVVKGLKKGTSNITVKTYNGKKAVVTVIVRKSPSKITPEQDYIRVGLGDTVKVGYRLPKGTAADVTFTGLDDAILKVDSDTGTVTGLAIGKANVRMRTHNGKEALCTVEVCPAPDKVAPDEPSFILGVGEVQRIGVSIPEGTLSSLKYTSFDPEIAVVSSDGTITAMKTGETDIRIDTCDPEVFALVHVTVCDAPEYVRFDVVAHEINTDEQLVLEPIIPEGSVTRFSYASSDPALATVSDTGAVTTRMRGEVFITAVAHNGKHASLRLRIRDPWYPESVALTNRPEALFAGGESYGLKYAVTPETARPLLKWSSSNEKVATVDPNGVVTPLSYGYTTIRAVSEKNPDAQFKFTLAVQEEDRILVIPARTTDESGIEENLAKIDDIRRSAIAQVNSLRASGSIKASDANKRKSMINNIFKDYAFAWKTPEFQKYWRTANSEGGVKHFRTDRVYYGMPYISGYGKNRYYTAAKALKENRFTDSGSGYYLLNRKKLLNGKYVGSDCSGLVSTAIWGTKNVHSSDRTIEIATSKSYKTVKSFKKMRPGDLICRQYSHVVMFLYYVNPEKTKIMVIENGGAEAGTNTVHCAVHDVSYYTKRAYKVRRLSWLG